MNLRQIALISQTAHVSLNELVVVGAALQKQITRDFTPIWNKPALISAFGNLNQVPLGYWPIIIRDDIHAKGAAGYHSDKNNQPFALVQYSPSWALTVSHEMLEMLADPYGNKLKVARSIKPGQGKVQYLVEVCDPSEDDAFAYDIQGVIVSDFYTPNYFDKLTVAGKLYSFTGAIKEPLQVLRGGYLSWLDTASGAWWQAQFFGAALKFVNLSAQMNKHTEGSLRSRIDRITTNPLFEATKDAPISARSMEMAETAQEINVGVGSHWDQEVQEVLNKYNK